VENAHLKRLGFAACEAGFRVKFYMLQELLSYLYSTLADNTTAEEIEKMARLDLIIIDRVGFIRKKDEYASLLLELISACQDRVSIITTSNISIEEWGPLNDNYNYPPTTIINAHKKIDHFCIHHKY
jgi:DNA replication protein DnaC